MSCPICYNNITDINKVVTECNHVFHFTCIYKNLKTNISTGEVLILLLSLFVLQGQLLANNKYELYKICFVHLKFLDRKIH